MTIRGDAFILQKYLSNGMHTFLPSAARKELINVIEHIKE